MRSSGESLRPGESPEKSALTARFGAPGGNRRESDSENTIAKASHAEGVLQSIIVFCENRHFS
jgi:hypothetical protein